MKPALSRLFLFLDEWIGIGLLLYLWRIGEMVLFVPVLLAFIVFVYIIGYPRQWELEKRWEDRQK